MGKVEGLNLVGDQFEATQRINDLLKSSNHIQVFAKQRSSTGNTIFARFYVMNFAQQCLTDITEDVAKLFETPTVKGLVRFVNQDKRMPIIHDLTNRLRGVLTNDHSNPSYVNVHLIIL